MKEQHKQIRQTKYQKGKIDKLIQQVDWDSKYTLSFLVENIKLAEAHFPLLAITYSLWRESAYSQIREKKQKQYQCSDGQLDYAFFCASEMNFLTNFINRVKSEMNIYCRGLEDVKKNYKGVQKFNKQQQEAYDMVVHLGENVWQQQLYIQLIEDLIQLPYLETISKKQKLIVKGQFQTGYTHGQKPKPTIVQNICDKVGQQFFTKTLNSVTTLLFSKALVLPINTLVGSFNPILMGASYGLSSFIKYQKQKKQDQALIDQLRQALKLSNYKIQKLQQIYTQCLQKIKSILLKLLERQQQEIIEQQKKQLKKMIMVVFEEQWLHIQLNGKDEEGWQIVNLVERQSFQQL